MLSQRPRFATLKSLAFLALGVVVAVGAARAPRPIVQDQPAPLAPLEMTVWTTEARLLIPFPRRDTWEWYLPHTPELEYAIDVTVDGDSSYRYGFSLWKANGPTQRGDLLSLMRAGQKTFWQRAAFVDTVDATGARHARTNWKAVDGIPVTVEPIGDSLLVTLDGARPVYRVFRSKPATVTLTVSTPYEPPRTVKIPVVYR